MGFKVRKSIKVCKGVKLNISKSGISTSVKVGNVTHNSKRGTTVNMGNGLSYHVGNGKNSKAKKQNITSNEIRSNNFNRNNINKVENSWDRMTDKQIKIYNIGFKILLSILVIMLAILAIVFPICLILSIAVGVYAYKFDAKKKQSKSKEKEELTTIYPLEEDSSETIDTIIEDNGSEESIVFEDYEQILIKRKNELYGDIERNAHNIKEVIDEYKEILNKLSETSCSEEQNIKILIDEINEKEPYILILNEMQHLIWELNNPEYCLPSSLVENVEKLESIYLPKIKEMEQKNIKVTETKSWQLETFIEDQRKKTNSRLKREEKKYLDKQNYIAFDIETTGLSPVTNEITEIGALKIKNGEVVDTFEMLVKPTKKISKKITDLTGITNEMVQDASPIEEVLPKFIEFTEKLPLVGHNIKFDYGFINENYKRINNKEFRRKKYCTMEMYKKWHKEYYDMKADGAKLGDAIAELLGIDEWSNYNNNAHRGLNDAEYAHKIYQKMIQR